MFRFLKALGKGKEPLPALGIDELPAWIEGEEGRVRDGLAGLVTAHRPVVLDALDRMEEVLSGFDAAPMEEVPHRKLAGVTERSLPLFLKAMRMSLSRDLPGEPDGFYAAIGEILKGCLSAFRGQGRYLSSRFPGEMKVLRDGVDTLGREANALTPEISRARERLRDLGILRESHKRYMDARRRIALGRERIRSLEEDRGRYRQSLEAVNHALADLERGEECQEYQRELARIRGLEEDRDETARLHHATAATALHLLKKGEKIASRKKDRDAARALREAAGLLEGALPLPEEEGSRIIPPSHRVIAGMVASGDLALKNREEMDLVEVPDRLLREVLESSRRFRKISEEIASAQGALLSRPALARGRDLKREAGELERQVAQAGEHLEQARGEVSELEGRIRPLLDDLKKRAEALSGRPAGFGEPAPA